jgi:hypothetical protein
LCGDSYFSIISYGIFALCAFSWLQCESLFLVVMYLNVLLVVVVARFLLLADKYSASFLFFFTISFFFPFFSHCGGSKYYQLWNLALRAFSCLQSHLPSFNVVM